MQCLPRGQASQWQGSGFGKADVIGLVHQMGGIGGDFFGIAAAGLWEVEQAHHFIAGLDVRHAHLEDVWPVLLQ